MKFIDVVEMTFDIQGRGLVVLPGIPFDFGDVSVDAELLFENPDGSKIECKIQGFEMIRRTETVSLKYAPFSVERSIKKGDIQIGAKIYLK